MYQNAGIILTCAFMLSTIGSSMAADDQPSRKANSVSNKPNFVLILSDDVGYGDAGCYGATKIKTPNIDRLAKEGMRFTQAYTPGSVCSPTRYGLMSGRYVWRTTRHHEKGVSAPSAPLLFELDRMTLASLFKQQGYATAAIGKWHLGFGEGDDPAMRYDWSQEEIKPGPCEVGFDYFYGMAANAGNQPCIYIENHRFVGRKPGDKVTMVGRSEIKPWSPDAEYKFDHVAGDLARKAVEFIQKSKDKPFFLYLASNIAHNDITPAKDYIGKSECGPYGDFMQELDAHVGQVMDALEKAGVLENTIVLFTSDNGGVVAPNERLAAQWQAKQAGHAICGALRGRKHSIYEGGFRVPFIVRWPGVVAPGTVNSNQICLTDVMATMADTLDVTLPEKAGEDSFSFLATLKGGAAVGVPRESILMRSSNAIYAIRKGKWKLIEKTVPSKEETEAKAKAQAKAEAKGKGKSIAKKERPDPENENQLFDLEQDPAETTNVWDKNPDVVKQLLAELDKARKESRTRK